MSMPARALNFSSFPEVYEDKLVGPLFRPWAEVLLDRVHARHGDRVLDVACGTGIVARVARERLGADARIVGIDISPQMLAVARTVAPDIDWREGSAAALPVADDERFDVVVCQQGLQFFKDRTATVQQMHRVLAPRGRMALSTWRPSEAIPIFLHLQEVAERHVGPIVDQRHAFGDDEALRRLLVDAGFADVRVETMTRTIRFDEGAVFVRLNAMALVSMSADSKALSEQARAQIVDAIARESAAVARPYMVGNAMAFDISSNVATARR